MLGSLKFVDQKALQRLEEEREKSRKQQKSKKREDGDSEEGERGGGEDRRREKDKLHRLRKEGDKLDDLVSGSRRRSVGDETGEKKKKSKREHKSKRHKEKKKKKGEEHKKRKHEKGELNDGTGNDTEEDSGGEYIRKSKRRKSGFEDPESGEGSSDDTEGLSDEEVYNISKSVSKREAAGLDWMTKAPDRPIGEEPKPKPVLEEPDKPVISSRELNHHWKSGDGTGFPQESAEEKRQNFASGIGDGGASWRLKALKRAKEQAAREGKPLDEVISDRWGSVSELTAGLSSIRAAPIFAHRIASRNRERIDGKEEEEKSGRKDVNMQSTDPNKKGNTQRSNNNSYEGGVRTDRSERERDFTERRERDFSERRERDFTERRERDSRVSDKDRGRHELGNVDGDDGDEKRIRENKRDYLNEVRSGRSQMRVPKQVDQLSWSKPNSFSSKESKIVSGESSKVSASEDKGREGGKEWKNVTNTDVTYRGREEREERGSSRASNIGLGHEIGLVKEGNSSKLVQKDPEIERRAKATIDMLSSLVPEGLGEEDTDTNNGKKEPLSIVTEKEKGKDEGREEKEKEKGMEKEKEKEMAKDKEEEKEKEKVDTISRGAQGSGAPPLSANQVAAKAMKLRLMGKLKEADALQKEAENLRKKEVVQLPLINAQGFAVEGAFTNIRSKSEEGEGEKKGKVVQRYDNDPPKMGSAKEGPARARYFADDDNWNLKNLVLKQKHGAMGENYDSNLAENIIKNQKFKAMPTADDEYDYDMGLELGESREKKGTRKKQMDRQASRQRADFDRMGKNQLQCQFCFDGPNKPKNLMIAIGNKTYLMLSPRNPLSDGHCFICTMQHEGSTRGVDEDVWEEIRNFKKCLIKMFSQQGQDVLFIETAVALNRQKRHCFVECIPVPEEVSKQAPLYFKKAIDEAEDEWSQHNAKKLIDTRGKGLRASIPKKLSLFPCGIWFTGWLLSRD